MTKIEHAAWYLAVVANIYAANHMGTPTLIFSALSAAFSLSVATGAIGVVGLLGAAAFVRWVPRFVPRARPASD